MLIVSHGIKGQGIEVEQPQVGEDEKTAEVEKGKGPVPQGVDSGVSIFAQKGQCESIVTAFSRNMGRSGIPVLQAGCNRDMCDLYP